MKELYELINSFLEAIELTLSYLNTPGKRIYYLYIFTSIFIAFAVYLSKKRKNNFFQYLFKKEIWLSKSAFIDYGFIFLNSLVKLIFVAPLLIFSLKIAFFTHEYLIDTFGYFKANISKSIIIGLYTITAFVVGDLASFLLHFLQHRIPFLWRFHAVHHSAMVLNPITQYRIHPVELMFNNIKSILIIGVLMGVFEYLGKGRISYYTFNGVNIINFLFLFTGANLRHSSVKLKYPSYLEYVFISPFQHQIHHSNERIHYDKNMGSVLAIWDWILGSLVISKEVKKVEFGLGERDDKKYSTFWKNLSRPFLIWKD